MIQHGIAWDRVVLYIESSKMIMVTLALVRTGIQINEPKVFFFAGGPYTLLDFLYSSFRKTDAAKLFVEPQYVQKTCSSPEECPYLRAESCKLYLPSLSPISYLWAVITRPQSFNLKYKLHFIKSEFFSSTVFFFLHKISLVPLVTLQIILTNVAETNDLFSTGVEKISKLNLNLHSNSIQVMTSCKCFCA